MDRGPNGATWYGCPSPEGPENRPRPGRAEDKMPAALDEIIAELSESDRQERIDLLIDFAKNLPPLPERPGRIQGRFSPGRGMPVAGLLFVEMDGDRVALYADAPIEAPDRAGIRLALARGPERGNGRGGAQGARRPGRALRPARDPGHAPGPRPHAACCGGSRAR